MKYPLIYLAMIYVVGCADDVTDHGDNYTIKQRVQRAIFWPLTLTNWFRTQNIRLHRTLNILWTLLICGWFLSLLMDRL